MAGAVIQYALLVVCWISALVTLVVFLESWFALTRRSRLSARAASGDHGTVSLLVPIRSGGDAARRGLESVLSQSYPHIETYLLYEEENVEHAALVAEFRAMPAPVPVAAVPVPFRIESEDERVRALEHAQPNIRGAWILVVDDGVVLDAHAVASALEFAANEDITAVAMIPGVECRSLPQKLLAPSLEWFVRMLRAVDRGREKSHRPNMTAPFLLLHGQTHAALNNMNRLPGVLNESGWALWTYRVEGLRTFQGDGAGWIAREATVKSLLGTLETATLSPGRVKGFAVVSAAVSAVSVLGIVAGLLIQDSGFAGLGILYFSAFGYSLMATSYYFYARQLGAAVWFAPLWFLPHAAALLLALVELRRARPALPATAVAGDRGREVPTEKP